jgi:hypothetical protein
MANVYVDSTAGGAATGADWANAYLTLAAALTAGAAGDSFYVAENHAETQATAMTLTSPGTIASPCRIICVNSAGTVPPVSADLATTGTVSTTVASAITYVGHAYVYGLTFSSGSGSSNASQIFGATASTRWVFDACKFVINTTSTISHLVMGAGTATIGYEIIFNNTTVKFGHVSQQIQLATSRFVWRNTASAIDAAGSFPTNLITQNATSLRAASAFIEGVDLSALGSGKAIVGAFSSSVQIVLKDCEFDAAVTACTEPTGAGTNISFIRCGASGNYFEQHWTGQGKQEDETTIVRTGGATDGTQAKARKITPNGNAEWHTPFNSLPITIWNTSTSAVTVTIYGIWGGGAVPTTADIWLDAVYPGDATAPLGSFDLNGTADTLAAGTNHTADGSTWGGSTTAFKMTATFTPAQVGPITLYVRAVNAGPFYIDPEPEISGVTVSRSYILAPGVYANELSSGTAARGFIVGG